MGTFKVHNGHHGRMRAVRTIGATEAKQKLGMVLDAARQEPIAITKHGRPVTVVVTIEDNQRLEQAVLDRPLEALSR